MPHGRAGNPNQRQQHHQLWSPAAHWLRRGFDLLRGKYPRLSVYIYELRTRQLRPHASIGISHTRVAKASQNPIIPASPAEGRSIRTPRPSGTSFPRTWLPKNPHSGREDQLKVVAPREPMVLAFPGGVPRLAARETVARGIPKLRLVQGSGKDPESFGTNAAGK